MLTYLISAVEELASAAVLCAIAFAYARLAWPKSGMRTVAISVTAGLVLAAVMAFMKQMTNMVDTGLWNMRIFVVAFAALIVLLVCFIKPVAQSKVGGWIARIALGIFVFCRVFYKVPDVYLLPTKFNATDDNLFSTDFAFRIIGYVAGVALAVLLCVALFKAFKALKRRPLGISLVIVSAIIGIVQMMTCLQTMLARRMIAQNHTLFELVKWFSNSSTLFIMVLMAIALVLAIAVIVLSLRDDEPYDNPAQHRKNKAKWRNKRRWAICAIVCIVLCAVTVTIVKDYDSRGPELSPSEECEIRDGNVYVPLEQVEDGHLHRFTYETEAGMTTESGYTTTGGVGVRFIVIKKPNATAYGIGLDACDICGETGYYERDGQVVCKLCDVVMNINTIGFKGGCNPIPVDYSIEDGYIVLPVEGLAEYEKTFKS